MNRCQTLDFILRNISECDYIFKLEKKIQILNLFAILCARVGKRGS